MSKLIVVVEKKKDWANFYPSEQVITALEYLSLPLTDDETRVRVINLCRSYRYLGVGYYVSLLAEARGHHVIPSVRTINDLSQRSIYSLDTETLDGLLNKSMEDDVERRDNLELYIHFGKTSYQPLSELARQIFDLFPCPLLLVEFKKMRHWQITSIKAQGIHDLSDEEEDFFAGALDSYSRKIWRKPRSRKKYRYDLAILHNPKEAMPPSDTKALQNFIRAGRNMGVEVELIEKKDYTRIAEYDALFIRETTAINHHTYRFAKRAESEGMVVIDDSHSILHCTNKIYLNDLLKSNNVGVPQSYILVKDTLDQFEERYANVSFPVVIKIPDGSFSRGMIKANNVEEMKRASAELFQKSALLIAQEFLYTDFDWRIGVLNEKPIFACKYFMSKGHWQIYNHGKTGVESGDFETLPISAVPSKVIKTAVKAASLVGKSLYGVDIKQVKERAVVIEVNDNPNIDSGVEDHFLGDDLYNLIINEFVRRLELKRLGIL